MQTSRVGYENICYNFTVPKEVCSMTKPSLKAKKAYAAKSRQSNYVASLRLEGFAVSRSDADRKLPTREAALNQLRASQA